MMGLAESLEVAIHRQFPRQEKFSAQAASTLRRARQVEASEVTGGITLALVGAEAAPVMALKWND